MKMAINSQNRILNSALLFYVLSILTAPLPSSATAQNLNDLSWTQQKCVLYQKAFNDALEILTAPTISEDFMAANAAFVESGCLSKGQVCPRTKQEIELVNLLTVLTMNEGMASTFVPIGCPN